MAKTKTIAVRVSDEMYADLERYSGGNISAFVIQSVKDRIAGKIPEEAFPDLTDSEKRKMLKKSGDIIDMLDQAMLARLQRNKNMLMNLDDESFLKLVKGRLPKLINNNMEDDQDVLSLTSILESMEQTDDITGELNKVKLQLAKTEHERDLKDKLLKNDLSYKERKNFAIEVFRSAVRYTIELLIRKGLPGICDADGLTEKGMGEVGLKVESLLKEMKIV